MTDDEKAKSNLYEKIYDRWQIKESSGIFCIIGGIVSAIISIPTTTVVCRNVSTMLQIWIAPKIWLIEYAAEIVKKGL